MSFVVQLQRTVVIVYCLFGTRVLFAVSVCKGLMSLFSAVCLQRTAVPTFPFDSKE